MDTPNTGHTFGTKEDKKAKTPGVLKNNIMFLKLGNTLYI